MIAILILATGLMAFGEGPFHRPGYGQYFEKGEPPFHPGFGIKRFHHHRNFAKRHHDMVGFLLANLKLTDDQLDKINKYRTEFISDRIEKNGKIRKLEFEKRNALRKHNFDKAKELSDEIIEIRKALTNNYINFRKQVWNTLTSKQKKEADKLIRSKELHIWQYEKQDELEKN